MAKNHFDIDGKIALVTGASRGIGAAIANILAEYGAHVVVSSRQLDSCQQVVEKITKGGGSAEARACHIGDMAQINDIMDYLKSQHGGLDILVNNAATNPYFGSVLDTDLGAFNKTVEVNIRGYFFMSIEGAKLMRERGGGQIINTASIAGLHPGPGLAIYSITKAAVISMTKCFALECASYGVRVNAILPGITKTKFAGKLVENEPHGIPLNRFAEPEEMAATVLYLVSPASSYTTGECIVVDGGMTIG